AYVFTQDLNTALVMSERLEFGMVAVNDWMPVTAEAPFGGVKGSGIGRETGSEGLHEDLEQKAVYIGGVQVLPLPAPPASRRPGPGPAGAPSEPTSRSRAADAPPRPARADHLHAAPAAGVDCPAEYDGPCSVHHPYRRTGPAFRPGPRSGRPGALVRDPARAR